MLDDLYQAGTDAALNDLAARPLPQPASAPKFSTWRALKAAPRGVAQGANESAGFFADALKAFGTIQASQLDSDPMARATLGDRTVEQGAKDAQASLQSGDAFTSQMGEEFRAAARDFMPDPQTAHVAERTIQGLARFATKAVGYSTAGPVAGPMMLGADEANQTAADLAAQGVDPTTRTKVAALTGASAAAAMVLPVAGSTVRSTVALTAAGGPGAYIAQTAATRHILQSAGYDQIAATYDPFDPVGLAVATLVPAGFGAWAMRGAARGKAGEIRPGEAATHGEPKPTDGAPAADMPRPTDEHVDAARVELLTQHVEAARLTPVADAAGARAHTEAMGRAMEQLAAGERVDVSDVAPAQAVQQAPGSSVEFKSGADGFISANTDAGTVGGHIRSDGLHITFAEVSPDRQGKGEGIRLYSALVDKALADGLRVFSDSTVEAAAVRVYEALKRRGYDVRRLDGGEIDGAAFGKGAKEPAFEVVSSPARASDSRSGAPAFKAWFGDSKVVDEQGKPLVAYHGTSADVQAFDPGQLQAEGIHLTTDPSVASRYAASRAMDGGRGANVVPLYVKADRVLDVQMITTDAIKEAAAKGFDAVRRGDHIVVMRPDQIKSAIGNSGKFDPNSPSLTDSRFSAWADQINAAIADIRAAAKEAANVQDAPKAGTDAPAGAARQPEPAAQPQAADARSAAPAGAAEQGGGVPRAGGATPEAAAVAARLAEVSQQFPDLTVQMDGMDAPMRLSDFLDQVRREAMDGTDFDLGAKDAPLMQLAAQCFLLNGG